ncbi:hypothetical protein D3C87_1920100 [compost metagenome]
MLELDTEIENDYRQELDSFNDQQKSLLAEQLLQTELNKERKKEEEKLEKLKAKALLEAEEYFKSVMESK